MITLHPAKADDFSTLGFGALKPSEAIVEEQAAAMFQLTLSHPMDALGRWKDLVKYNIIKAPAPVRETPEITIQAGETVQREIYRVDTPSGMRLHLRQKPSMEGKIISKYPPGTEVVRTSVSGDWAKVVVRSGGESGWMWADYLTYVRTDTETLPGADSPGQVIQPRQTRAQLFRISDTERDDAAAEVRLTALHITFDLAYNAIRGELKLENVPAGEAVARIMAAANDEHPFNAYCISGKTVSGDFTGRSVAAALWGDGGVTAQIGGRLIRDNFDIFILDDEVRNTGVEIRHGKNMTGAILTEDVIGAYTRIIPVGKDREGNRLEYRAPGYVESPRAADVPVVRSVTVEYDVQVGVDGIDSAEEAWVKLEELALADFEKGMDGAVVSLDVDFVQLENTTEYGRYAGLQTIHMYDTVNVISTRSGIRSALRMTGYRADVGGKTPKYIETLLGDISGLDTMLYGYDIVDGTLPGTKILPGSVGGNAIAPGTLDYVTLSAAAIGLLSADALHAVEANINELIAGKVTADVLQAGSVTTILLAAEAVTTEKLAAKSVTAEKIAAGTISADQIAAGGITAGNIASGTITAEQLMAGLITADSGLIAVGAIQTAQIADGSITAAKIVSLNADVINAGTLSVERLMLVGEDGIVYHINASSAGLTAQQLQDETYQHYLNGTVIVAKSITAEQIAAESITGNEIQANTITSGKLNVAEIFANAATIAALNAYDITGNEYLRLFVPAQAGSVASGTTLLINGEQFRVITPKAVFAILSEDSPDGEELLSIDENGVSGRTAAFDELRSPTVLQATAQAKYAPASGGELSAIMGEISGTYLKGDVSIDASNVSGGRLTLRGLMGGGRLLITGGTFAGVSLNDCTALVRFEGSVFTSAGTAITLDNARLVLARCSFSAKQGLALMRDADAVLGSCTGACTTLATLNGGSELRITGDNLPYGVIPDGVDGEVYSPYPFLPAPEEPEAEAETEIALTATASRTWDNGWLSTSVYGSAVYQGAVNGGALRRGCIWFDRSAISGKEILSATLSVRRMTGFGGGGAVEVGVYGTTAASAGGTPMLGAKYASASIAREETKVIDVTQAVQHLADGDIAGLVLYDANTKTFNGKSYTYNYAKFYGSGTAHAPVLTVRYRG